MKKYMILIICLSPLLLSSPASSETKVFVEECTYQASEADSKISSRVIALEEVKRLLLEKLGTYLEGETEVKKFRLTKDQIISLTAAIVTAEVIEEEWNGKTYFLKAKMAADLTYMYKSIDNLLQYRQKTKEMEETRKKADEALREVQKVKKELEIAKAEKPNLSEYNEAIDRLSAIDWVEKGYALGNAHKWEEARDAFTRAIELDPKLAMAYDNRGGVSFELGNHRQAIKDYDRAIELDPKYAMAYSNRGATYGKLGNHRQAIKDCDRAIELDPKYAMAYYNRAVAYENLGDHRQSIKDSDRAIELDSKYAMAYYNRAFAYHAIGDNQQAFRDYKTAAKLGHKPAQDYLRSQGIKW